MLLLNILVHFCFEEVGIVGDVVKECAQMEVFVLL